MIEGPRKSRRGSPSGGAMFLTVLAFNLIGDTLDPDRSRQGACDQIRAFVEGLRRSADAARSSRSGSVNLVVGAGGPRHRRQIRCGKPCCRAPSALPKR
jgi:hypothetical protein